MYPHTHIGNIQGQFLRTNGDRAVCNFEEKK